MKRISIFGATGSIGQNTLDLIRRDPGAYQVIALSGGCNVDQLAKDAIEFQAQVAVTAYPELLPDLQAALGGTGIKCSGGATAIEDAAAIPADWIMSAIVGLAGLMPGLIALKHGTTLALANKESLVSAGPLLLATAKKHGAQIIPVDSEHSAIFQALIGEDFATVERVIVTASGGAFRDWPQDKLAGATPGQAATHPNWAMGQRITIDSASMFNKALELIEAKEFFGASADQIETIIHPESMIHALVGFNDGALMAHVGPPDMRHAIGFALHYPNRTSLPVEKLDLAKMAQLRFYAADENRYPALRLAREVLHKGGLWGAALNASKEIALDRFIACDIGFLQMADVVEQVLNTMDAQGLLSQAADDLDRVMAVDACARDMAKG